MRTLIHWAGPGWYGERAAVGSEVQAWRIGEPGADYGDLAFKAYRLGLGIPFYLEDRAAAERLGEVDR